MNNQDVDTDKILKHIEYTKHWLDKANKNYEEKSFANGSVTLNLARAELTAAWEEAMQLKTRIFRTLPGKAKANWKPMTSVGMLASGFLIAFFMIRFTNNNVPEPGAVRETPLPAIVAEPAAESQADAVVVAPPLDSVQKAPAPKTRPAAAKASAPASQPAVSESVERQPEAVSAERETVEVQPAAAERVSVPEKTAPAQRELSQSEIIELMKAAERALVK
jgi:hypothetical protein